MTTRVLLTVLTLLSIIFGSTAVIYKFKNPEVVDRCSSEILNAYVNTVFGEILKHNNITIKQDGKSYHYKLVDIKEN